MMGQRWDDHKTESIIGILLRTGVMLAAAVVFLGAVVYLARHGGEALPDYSTFHPPTARLRSVGGIIRASLDFSGRGIIQLGLLLLIATPVARVIFSAVAFALERDRLYVGITLSVLIILLFSLFGSEFR